MKILICSLGPYNYFSILAIQKNYYRMTHFIINIEGKEYQCLEGENQLKIKKELILKVFV